MSKNICFFLLALVSCSLFSSCTTSRTYHVTETTYENSIPVVKESVVVVRKAPVRFYVEEYESDYFIIERPWYGSRYMMYSDGYYHRSRCYRPRSSHAELHFGFGFRR